MKATSKIVCLKCGWEDGGPYEVAYEVDPTESIEGLVKRMKITTGEAVKLQVAVRLPAQEPPDA